VDREAPCKAHDYILEIHLRVQQSNLEQKNEVTMLQMISCRRQCTTQMDGSNRAEGKVQKEKCMWNRKQIKCVEQAFFKPNLNPCMPHNRAESAAKTPCRAVFDATS